jgi:hypothetical protein
MTSYTKQLRTSKGVIAALSRENIDQAPAPVADEMTPEAATAVLAEPVAQEIEQDVLAPAEQIEQGTDALMEAEADAGLLENTAQILEDASGETAADVDVATPELANITVERISAKYGMARTAVLSKESLGAAAGRVESTRFISKEAFEKAGELRKRVSEGVAKLIEWFKNLIKNIFDKRTKLENRLNAVLAMTKTKEGVKASEDATINVTRDIAELNVSDVSALIYKFKKVEELAKENAASMQGMENETLDFNPKKLGGVTLICDIVDGKVSVTKQTEKGQETLKKAVPTLTDVTEAAKMGLTILKDLKTAEASCEKIVAEMGSATQKLKALVTGEDNGAGATRGNILARYQGVTTLAGALSAVTLKVVADLSTMCEQSLAAY